MTAGRETLHVAEAARVRQVLAADLRPHRLRFVVATVVLVLGAVVGLAPPRLMGAVVDLADSGHPVLGHTGAAGVWWSGGVTLVAVLLAALLEAVGFVLMAGVVDRVVAGLRERAVASGLRLRLARVDRVGVGDLVSRTTDDVTLLTQTVTETLPVVTGAAVTVAVTVVGLAVLDWRFAAALLVLLPVYVLAVRAYRRDAPPHYAAERAARGSRAVEMLATLRGLRSVHAFGLHERRRAAVARHSWEVVRHSVAVRIVNNRLFGAANAAEWAGMSLLLAVGYRLVGRGEIGVGAVTAATLLFLRLFGPVGQLLFVVDPLSSASISLRRLVGITDEAGHLETAAVGPDAGHPDAESSTVEGPDSVGRSVEGLCVEGLRVRIGGREVVRGVDLHVPRGSTVAVVGPSGAGKSTLAAAIAGLRPTCAGSVRVEGREVAGLPEHERARTVGLVTQEVHVFSGPLAEDLRLARPDASDDELREALRVVGALEWAQALPEGLSTVVGSHGHPLGPARGQQVALARMVLVDPPVVVLDEAGAEAGSAATGELERATEAVTAGRTAVVVAHRLDQAERADLVVHVRDGLVAECGTHTELVAAGGGYAELWRAWSRGR